VVGTLYGVHVYSYPPVASSL